ncbi:DUF2799 domain-containing protein [Shewanella khirikhana]|uniref:DUF2799 domain-containing protein n=1 Tax=Shewanella khirikhana TaxID=1965282 RepID=UPI0030D116E1
MHKKIMALTLLSLLTGCSSLSVEDCANTDWKEQGYGEAKAGFSLKRYDYYAQECKELGGVIPPKADYTSGHYQGTQEFCTSISGYKFGKEGGYYQQSCKEWKLDETVFFKGYQAGTEYYKAQKAVDDDIKELEDNRSKASATESSIASTEEKLKRTELTNQQRADLQIELQNLRSRYNELVYLQPRKIERIEANKRMLEAIVVKHNRLNYCDYQGCFSDNTN